MHSIGANVRSEPFDIKRSIRTSPDITAWDEKPKLK